MAKLTGEASSSGERWPPEDLSKYTIFLSHSGNDKPFVERLFEKLISFNYSPFFDQDRDSLPKGEEFPPYIFEAAKQCMLAVIVLSEGYLTSKWPMLELAAFVKSKKTNNPKMKLFPVFYKLRPSDLVPGKWLESMKKLAEDGKIPAEDIDLWIEALKVFMEADYVESEVSTSLRERDDKHHLSKFADKVVKCLRPFNGEEFSTHGRSEGKFIEAVVDVICHIIPPAMKYSKDGIRGYQRLCEKASSLFKEGTLSGCKPGCLYLGLYGMGGVGKTTLCVAMCRFYEVEFRGRVCHVELQGDTADKRLERLKRVIRQLGGLDDRILDRIAEEPQAVQCLQDRLQSQPAAFLAVDNVGDSQSSRDEAWRFISCGLAVGSKVMVTSRSRLILKSVLREGKCPIYCKPIPRLEEQEAEELFLSVAIPQKMSVPLEPGEEEVVKACVEECKFFDDGYDVQQYHPLVLRALGTFYHDADNDDIMEWKEALMTKKKVQESRESKHVNDILGLNYVDLSDGQKLLFLDLVLLFNSESFSLLHYDFLRPILEDKYKWLISLLAALHGISTSQAEMRVKELQRKSLLYESSPTLRTHDLYIEFAQSLVSVEGSKEKEWWEDHKDANGYNLALKRLVLLVDEPRIGDRPQQLWECPNLECLNITYCHRTLEPKLDLKCFTKLRVLIIVDCYFGDIWTDMEIVCTSDAPHLRIVTLFGFRLRQVPFLRRCWNLTSLTIRDCHFSTFDFIPDGTSLFENLKALETLNLGCAFDSVFPRVLLDDILRGAAKLKNLKCLEIDFGFCQGDSEAENVSQFCRVDKDKDAVNWGYRYMKQVPIRKLDLSPLGHLTSLKTLSLPYLPYHIHELTGLDQLTHLIELNLYSSRGLLELPGLDLLPKLEWICVNSSYRLSLPVDKLTRFQKFLPGHHKSHECLAGFPLYPSFNDMRMSDYVLSDTQSSEDNERL